MYPTFISVIVFLLILVVVLWIVCVRNSNKIKDRFATYLSELDKINERLKEENARLKSRLKKQ